MEGELVNIMAHQIHFETYSVQKVEHYDVLYTIDGMQNEVAIAGVELTKHELANRGRKT